MWEPGTSAARPFSRVLPERMPGTPVCYANRDARHLRRTLSHPPWTPRRICTVGGWVEFLIPNS
jgi:hypothetical protein